MDPNGFDNNNCCALPVMTCPDILAWTATNQTPNAWGSGHNTVAFASNALPFCTSEWANKTFPSGGEPNSHLGLRAVQPCWTLTSEVAALLPTMSNYSFKFWIDKITNTISSFQHMFSFDCIFVNMMVVTENGHDKVNSWSHRSAVPLHQR